MSDPNYDGMDEKTLRNLLRIRDRQSKASTAFWVRAAERALDGDPRELRNRVELAKAPPVNVVLSSPLPHPLSRGDR